MIDKIYTSYYYNLRYFRPYMIPISTTVWDPKWYHDNKFNNHIFVDKRGVVNGLGLCELKPGDTCVNLCRGPKYCSETPSNCLFLKKYKEQLDGIDFNRMMDKLEGIVYAVRKKMGFREEPVVVLMFYEVPNNPCSERSTVQNWFDRHGVVVPEWNRKTFSI